MGLLVLSGVDFVAWSGPDIVQFVVICWHPLRLFAVFREIHACACGRSADRLSRLFLGQQFSLFLAPVLPPKDLLGNRVVFAEVVSFESVLRHFLLVLHVFRV
jgi:hypothetical protein